MRRARGGSGRAVPQGLQLRSLPWSRRYHRVRADRHAVPAGWMGPEGLCCRAGSIGATSAPLSDVDGKG
jgi:hypothetical protein